ncbi:unnamed protein product, partial [Rotaria sp. Silwood2]
MCKGCSKDFCDEHLKEHHNEFSEQLGKTEDLFNEFKIEIEGQKAEPQQHELMEQIDKWEYESIEKIRQVANKVRWELSSYVITYVTDQDLEFKKLRERLIQCRKDEDFIETDIQFFNEELKRLKGILNNPPTFKIEYDSTSLINKIHFKKEVLPLRGNSIDIHPNARWQQNGLTIAGGNGRDNGFNQLSDPLGLYVDNDQTIYIADRSNHRIIEWKWGAMIGQVVAGGNGPGSGAYQLSDPRDVIVDKDTDSLIISDYSNKRVVRWSRQNGTNGETIISNIRCVGLTMDENGSLYIIDNENDEVRRYRRGESQGTVVAGGNGSGNRLDQLSDPQYVFVDRDHSVYVSDLANHRVMKWLEGEKEGIVVAGGQGKGNDLTQLSHPRGVVVDQLGTVYVADAGNDRIMRWPKGATQGGVIIGGKGAGRQSNQLNGPFGLSFDRYGTL